MDLRDIGLGGVCGLDSTGSGQGLLAGCGECSDEPSCSCATELVSQLVSCSVSSASGFKSNFYSNYQ
jgi:hypothetical protein